MEVLHTPADMIRMELIVQMIETPNWIIHRRTGILIVN